MMNRLVDSVRNVAVRAQALVSQAETVCELDPEMCEAAAMVYVGDCMEENVDDLCQTAGELSLLGLPLFLFQEGHDSLATQGFKELARLTRGVHCKFDAGSARQLAELLSAVAVYAAGGQKALSDHAGTSQGGKLLLEQLGRS